MIDLTIAKPILFNTGMVRAILLDIKTNTRRPIKGQFDVIFQNGVVIDIQKKDNNDNHIGTIYPPYQPGDILYVRETWCPIEVIDLTTRDKNHKYLYRASHTEDYTPIWRPSIHMPKVAARIFLKVTDVKVERLNDITEDDAKAEGVVVRLLVHRPYGEKHAKSNNIEPTYKTGFANLWDRLCEKSCDWLHKWDNNPWVWVISFERMM